VPLAKLKHAGQYPNVTVWWSLCP